MKKRILSEVIFFFLVSLVSIHVVTAQVVTSSEFPLLASQADILISDAIEYKEHVGLTAGVFADGQIAWTGGAGYRDRKAKALAEPGMINRTASISKSMTAVAIMQLKEKGKLDLDASIQTYVPEYPVKPEGEITVRQLLTHTSGVPSYKSDWDSFSWREFKSLEKAMDRFKKRDLKGTPGKIYHYTTYGYVLLGLVIERCSGMPYETYMKKYIWDVAGMSNTSVEKKKVKVANKSRLYKRKKGKLKKDIKSNLSMKVPGGGIQSTAGDLLKFGQAIIDNKLISKETLEEMFYDPEIKDRGNPNIMGFFLYADDDEQGRVIGHTGAQAGTSTQMMILLDKGIVVSVLSNTRSANVATLTRQLIDLALSKAAREQPIRKAIVADESQLDRFVGSYDFGENQILTISRKGEQLYSDVGNFPTMKLYMENDTTIFYRDMNARFEFEFDQNNQVVKTAYIQNGETGYPKKIE